MEANSVEGILFSSLYFAKIGREVEMLGLVYVQCLIQLHLTQRMPLINDKQFRFYLTEWYKIYHVPATAAILESWAENFLHSTFDPTSLLIA